MSVIQLEKQESAAMRKVREGWQREVDNAQEQLEVELRTQRLHNAEGVRIAHRIDQLKRRIEMRMSNLAKYRA